MEDINGESSVENESNPELIFFRTSEFREVPTRCLVDSDHRDPIEKWRLMEEYKKRVEEKLPLFEEQEP